MTKSKATKDNMVEKENVTPNDPGWTDQVLGLLLDDEKISGNPTTDGLRRIFEIALNCRILCSTSQVVQMPDPSNEKRATVCHSITYRLNPHESDTEGVNTITVDGSADVYWGNCDKLFRNHPVAVAETRAEGRALRRALKLKKVVAAEEIAQSIEDDVDGVSASKISSNQINFIDVIAKRLNINVINLLNDLDISSDTVYNMSHENAVTVIQKLNYYQQNLSDITDKLLGYHEKWK